MVILSVIFGLNYFKVLSYYYNNVSQITDNINTKLIIQYKQVIVIYTVVIAQSVLVYGSETLAMKVDDMQRLQRTERLMVRWMCSVSD